MALGQLWPPEWRWRREFPGAVERPGQRQPVWCRQPLRRPELREQQQQEPRLRVVGQPDPKQREQSQERPVFLQRVQPDPVPMGRPGQVRQEFAAAQRTVVPEERRTAQLTSEDSWGEPRFHRLRGKNQGVERKESYIFSENQRLKTIPLAFPVHNPGNFRGLSDWGW